VKLQRAARRAVAACLTLLFAIAIPTFAQEVTANITGRITDPSEAPIVGAAVTARDTARGTVWRTETNTEGVYNLPRVPIGTYEVRVEAAGFQTAVRPAFDLTLNQTARIDVQMTVGSVQETVEVTSEAPILQTDTTQLGTIINSTTNESLPLATRNYVQLTLLVPGSTNPNPSSMTGSQTTGSSGRPYINGNREQANNFILDGIDNNQVSDNLVGYAPSVDAIQEFNLITNNASAEFGNFQGGIVSTFIKSGTNEFHGNAFWFFRNDQLNANTWSNNWQGAPREALRWNMFGGTLGGPIVKDRLFFFADYQGQRFNRPTSVASRTLMTARMRQGDFSELLTQKGIQLYNPFDIVNGERQPFPNNQIPPSLMDPVARNLLSDTSLYPLPTSDRLENNYLVASRSQTHGDQGDIKIDANLTDSDRLFGRYSQSQQSSPSFESFPLSFPGFFDAPTKNGVLNWTHTFGPTIVNEARAGVNYVLVHNGGQEGDAGNIAEQIGIQNGNERGPGLMAFNFSGGVAANFGNANIGTQQKFANTVIQFQDNVVITRGRHVMRTGFQYMRLRINTFYAGNNGRTGQMDFTGRFTAGPDPLAVAGGGAGAGEADFFLGLPNRLGRGVSSGGWGQRSSVFAGFFQDDWRVTDSLNLNLGLRYENRTPWVEVYDRQVNFEPFSGAIQYAGEETIYNNDRALYNSYNHGYNWQPRIGFAWSPGYLNKIFVVRAAYTISSYLEGTGTNLRLPLNPPINQEFETRYDNFTLPLSTTAQGLTVLSTPGDPFAGSNIRLWDPYIKPALAQQWNFTIQTKLSENTTLQTGYVGQKGTHLMVPMPYAQDRLNPDGSITPSPYLSGNPDLANISQISGTESNGTMRYDALQAVLQRRFSGGLQYQVAYTYSKCMTDSIGYYGSWGGQVTPASPYWQNLYDKRAEWGPCYYDVPHMLTSYAVYEIPFGRGKKYGSDIHPLADAIVGGWKMSGILSLRKGFPQTIQGGDASGTGSRGPRANCNAPATEFGKRNSSSGGYLWFDPSVYSPPDPGTHGTCGVGTVRGPGLSTLDLSLQKQFTITEGKYFEFRAEALNLTNTPILNAPTPWLGGDLGRVTGSQGARNVQLGLKFYF
jgi:hypothetical protein